MKDLHWTGNFPDVSIDEWKTAASAALSDSDPSSLTSDTYETIPIEPLYHPAQAMQLARLSGNVGASPFIRGERHKTGAPPWTVIQLLNQLDIAEANRQLLDDVKNGTGGVWLQFGGNHTYGGAFLGARKLRALETVFADAPIDRIELYLSGGVDGIAAAAILTALIEKGGTPPARIKGSACLDPLSYVAASGYAPALRRCLLSDAVDVASYFREAGYGWTPFLVSGRTWHQAGGSAREELGIALAAAVFYWRGLIDAGWPLDEAASAISFSLTADADLFMTLAKMRAMRALWARVTEAADLKPKRARIVCEMSYRMTTERDPYVNMLRATAAAFAAGAGGADAVLLLPFNSCYATPDAFARRMARNAQLILQEEAALGRVADPAGGSYYVESLTHELARKSWDFFREIEGHGGALAALDSGFINRVLADCTFRRNRNVAHSRDKLTGVSSYPNLDEQTVYTRPEDFAIDINAMDEDSPVAPVPCPNRGKRFAALVAAAAGGATLNGLENACKRLMERVEFVTGGYSRLAEPFEQLRQSSDLAMSRVKTRPPVFLANLGKLADYSASASWARSFFAAGGIQTLDQGGYVKREDLIRAFQRSPAPVACICVGENDLDRVKGAPAALKEAGAAAIYFAGDPALLPRLEKSDRLLIDRVFYEGCNMLAVLSELHEVMGVKELGEAEPEEFDDDEQGALFALRS